MSNLLVGIAEVDYTPELGLPLMGNYRVDYAARGVHDPLMAKAMVFADSDGNKAALLAMDICMLDRRWVQMMRNRIALQCDVPGGNIIVAATHTHSGAAPMDLEGMLPKADDETIEAFLTKAATAVVEANADLKPATLRLGTTEETRLSFNRRLRCKDGQTHMNWEGLEPDFVVEPLGPIDPQVIALSVEREGAPAAVVVNFGLHPAILAGDNWLYSADYPGYLSEAMRRMFGQDFVTLFCNGCCGNVNHIDYTDGLQGRGYKTTQQVGYMLAVAAQEAMQRSVEIDGDRVAASSEMVRLDRLKVSDEQVSWSRDVLARAKDDPAPGQVDGLPDETYAKALLMMRERQDAPDEAEVMALRIGDTGLAALPGEVFCEFGMDIKTRSPAAHTMVTELANDAIGYLPTGEAFDQGGYESTPGTTFHERDAGGRITASAVKQLALLFDV